MNPLIAKLEQFARLSDGDRRLLEDAARDVRRLEAHRDVIAEGDRPDHVHLLLEGWAVRYKVLPGGERAIMAYLIPGDLCDLHVALLDRMDHSIGTLTPARVAYIPRGTVGALMGRGDDLARALLWSTLVDEAILREWLVSMGRRPADKRVAHLVCEMLLRSRAVGLTDDDGFDLPLTQEELADTMGITPVHMNRTLQLLRQDGLITTEGRRVTVSDPGRLMELADFDPNYLHQEGGGPARPARA